MAINAMLQPLGYPHATGISRTWTEPFVSIILISIEQRKLPFIIRDCDNMQDHLNKPNISDDNLREHGIRYCEKVFRPNPDGETSAELPYHIEDWRKHLLNFEDCTPHNDRIQEDLKQDREDLLKRNNLTYDSEENQTWGLFPPGDPSEPDSAWYQPPRGYDEANTPAWGYLKEQLLDSRRIANTAVIMRHDAEREWMSFYRQNIFMNYEVSAGNTLRELNFTKFGAIFNKWRL